jgi:hypothetical protein
VIGVKKRVKRRGKRRKWKRVACSFFGFCVVLIEKKEQAGCRNDERRSERREKGEEGKGNRERSECCISDEIDIYLF